MRIRAVLIATLLAIAGRGGLGDGMGPGRDGSPLFSSYDLLQVTITAPFEELFSTAQGDQDYSVRGVLTHAGASGDVEISVRGGTSRRETECSFPKLKLRFQKDAPSVFRDLKTVKVGTHCGDRGDGDLTPRFGRWANEKSPLREAFVYRLLDALEVTSLRARPARITYVDEDRRTVRNAFFLEDDGQAMKRLGGVREIEPAAFHSADRDLAPEDTAKLAFAEAAIGNFDWCLKFSPDDTYRCDARRRLWNVAVFARDEGPMVPVMYDFDIAGMVAGRHLWFAKAFNDRFLQSRSAPAIEVLSQVQRTRSLFPRGLLDDTRRRFLSRKSAAYDALRSADLDADGRANIERYLNAFFGAIERDDRFYIPVIVQPDVRVYREPEKTREACGVNDTIPVGTPVSAPIATQGDMVQVTVLDALWRWAPPARCDVVHSDAVWIARGAIGTEYPRR